MSEQVDTRIVEMQFDDAQFKAGVKDTIAAIKNLDDALELEDGASGLDKVAKAVKAIDVFDVTKGIEQVEGKFSGLKKTAIDVVNGIGGVFKGSLWTGGIASALAAVPVVAKSISGGMTRAAKLAQSEFQFEGLGVTGSELATLMDRVSQSVNDTAYGLDDASNVASMLFASGIKDVDQLGHALDNVSNVAATFNADYRSIADVFAKVASSQKMQGEEFNQLATKGMNAKAVIAEYLQTEEGAAKYTGLIEKYGNTEAAITDMSKKGEIGFDLLVDSMDKFSGNAKKSNETFSGVTANIGAALSRTTADFFQYTQHNKNGLIKVLNDVRAVVNNFNKTTNILMHDVVKDADGNVTHLGIVIQGVLNILDQVHNAMNMFNTKGSDKYSDGLSEFFHKWAMLVKEVAPLIEGFFNRVASVTYSFVSILYRLMDIVRGVMMVIVKLVKPIAQAFDEVFGETIVQAFKTFDKGLSRIVKTLDALKPSNAVVQMLYHTFKLLFMAIRPIVDIIGGALIHGFNVIVIGAELLYSIFDAVVQVFMAFFDAISPVTDLVADFFGVIRGGAGGAGNAFLDFVRSITVWLKDFAEGVRNGIPAIREFFKPLKDGMTAVAEAIRSTGFLELLRDALTAAVKKFSWALEHLGPVLKDLYDFLTPVGEAFADVFGKAVNGVADLIESSGIGGFFSDLASHVSEFLGLNQAFADTGDKAQEGADGLDEFGKRFGEAAVAARDGAIEFGGRALDALVNIATAIWNMVGPALNWLFDLFGQIGGIIADAFSNSGISWDPVIAFFNRVGELASDFFKLFEEGLPSLEDFGKFFEDIGGAAKELFDDFAPKFGEALKTIGGDIASQTDGPLGQLSGVIGAIVENIGRLPEVISQMPSGIDKLFENIFKGIDGFMRNPLGVQKAYAATGEEGELSGAAEAFDNMQDDAFNLSTAINNITKFLKTPLETARKLFSEGFVGAMKGIGDGINQGLASINFEVITMFIENLKNVAVTFASLWGTFALVSVFESIREIFAGIAKWTDSIDSAIKSFGSIGSSISGMFKTIGDTISNIGKSIEKDMAANRFLKYMLGTIAMIGTIVAAIVILGRMDSGEIKQGGIAIAQILGVLIIYQVLMMLISRINTAASGAATLAGLTGMGLALLMVARAIGTLGKMDPNELKQGGFAIGILMVIIGVMASLVGAFAANGIKGAVLLITFGIMLKALAVTIAAYALMPWPTYRDGMIKMVAVLAALVLAARIVSKAEANVMKAAGAIVLMAGSLGMVALAIGLLNLVTGGDTLQAAGLAVILTVSLIGIAQALSLLSAFEGSLIKASVSVVLVTTCLMLIGAAIGILNLVTMGNPVTAVVMGGVLVGMLLGMAKTMQMLGNKTRQLPNATAAIFNMTIALGAITACLAILTGLATFNLVGMVVSAVVLAGLMLTLAGSIILIGRFGAKISAAIPAIWSMTLAIAAIGAAIAVMTLLSGGNVGALAVAGLALAGTLIVMAAAIAVLSKEGLKADMAATAMLELAAALAVIAVSIALLGSMEIPQIVQAFVSLLLVVGLLAVAAVAVTALSGAFVIFDGVLLILGLALVAIAASFYLFVTAMAELAEVAPESFQAIIDSKDKMIEAFGAMGEAIATAITSFFATLIGGIGEGLTGIAGEVEGHGPEIGTAAMSIGKALGEGIIFGFGGMVLGIGAAIAEGIGNAISGVSQTVAENGGAMSYEMSQSMAEHPEWYQSAGEKTMDQFTEGAEQSDAPEQAGEAAVGDLDEAAQQAAEETDSSQIMTNMFDGIELPDEIKSQFGDMFDPSQFENLGLDLGNVIPGNIMTGASASPIDPSALMKGMNLVTESFDPDAQGVGQGIGNSVSTGAATTMADTSPVDAAIGAQLAAIEGRSGEYNGKGQQSGQQYGQGVNTGIGGVDINPSIVANTAKMAAALGPAKTSGEGVGRAFSSGEMSGIQSLSWSVAAAAKSVTSNAGDHTGSWNSGYWPGKDFSYGMAEGINAAGYAVTNAARKIVKDAMEASKEEADSNSPSKKMIEQGEWFGQGFAIGIKQTGDLVNQNAESMVVQAMDEVKESFGVMDTLLDMIDWDAQPTITPVLDLSDYESGIRRMGRLDTSASVNRVGWAARIYPSSASASTTAAAAASKHVEVHLDWHAGVTANQMALKLANELEKYDLMEA